MVNLGSLMTYLSKWECPRYCLASITFYATAPEAMPLNCSVERTVSADIGIMLIKQVKVRVQKSIALTADDPVFLYAS